MGVLFPGITLSVNLHLACYLHIPVGVWKKKNEDLGASFLQCRVFLHNGLGTIRRKGFCSNFFGHTHARTHMHTNKHPPPHTKLHTDRQIQTHTDVHTYTHTHTHTHTPTPTHKTAHRQTQTHTHTHTARNESELVHSHQNPKKTKAIFILSLSPVAIP